MLNKSSLLSDPANRTQAARFKVAPRLRLPAQIRLLAKATLASVRNPVPATKPNQRLTTKARSTNRLKPVTPPAKTSQAEVLRPIVVIRDPIPVTLQAETSAPTVRAPYDSDSSLSLYMRHVGEVPLLTIAEEIALAARIKAGDEIAREHMIRANLRLVVKIAREYENLGLPLLDLINEGNIGLMKAVERFDPAKGGKLSTYGSWWIKQCMRRALANQSKTIRLPVHVVDKLCKIRRAANLLHEVLGRDPTDEELAIEMNMPAWRIAEMRAASVRPASLEAPLGDDDSSRLGDVVEDQNAVDPFEELQDKSMTHMVLDFVEELPEREATILRRRFGLDGDKEQTLEEIGQRFGVTRERIRQLQNIALTKLRRMVEKMESVGEAA
jgi:RNA polymerase primary sigma factor